MEFKGSFLNLFVEKGGVWLAYLDRYKKLRRREVFRLYIVEQKMWCPSLIQTRLGHFVGLDKLLRWVVDAVHMQWGFFHVECWRDMSM